MGGSEQKLIEQLEASLLSTLKWRRIGVIFWSFLVMLPTLLLTSMSLMLSIPLIMARIIILSTSLYHYLGLRYRMRIALILVDFCLFTVAFISPEWNKVEVDEDNLMHFSAENQTNWPMLLAGRCSWALLVTFVYHAIARAEYHLIFSTIMQRRLFRIRQAVPKAMRAALRVVKALIVPLVVVALLSLLVISPLDASMSRSVGPSNVGGVGAGAGGASASNRNDHLGDSGPSGQADKASSVHDSTGSQKSASNPRVDAFLRPRQRAIPATQFLLYLLRNTFHFAHLSMQQMNLFSMSHVFARLFEILLLTVGLEMVWHVSAIIHTERFSFDPCAQLSRYMNDGNSLLKSNAAILQSMRNTRRATPLIVGLTSKNKFVKSHALQDLLDLACHHPDRRADIYQDYQGGSWDQLSNIAIEEMDILTRKLEESQVQSSKSSSKGKSPSSSSKEGASPSSNASTSKYSKSPASSLFSSPSSLLRSLLPSLLGARKSLDAGIRRIFKFARPAAFDFSLEFSLSHMMASASPAAMQTQMNMKMLLRAIARLMSKSVGGEDMSGTIASSGKIPMILSSMLSLFSQLESYSEKNASAAASSPSYPLSPGAFNGHGLSSSFSQPLLATLTEAIYEITTTYYEHLVIYQFEPAHLPLLQRFLDFAI